MSHNDLIGASNGEQRERAQHDCHKRASTAFIVGWVHGLLIGYLIAQVLLDLKIDSDSLIERFPTLTKNKTMNFNEFSDPKPCDSENLW